MSDNSQLLQIELQFKKATGASGQLPLAEIKGQINKFAAEARKSLEKIGEADFSSTAVAKLEASHQKLLNLQKQINKAKKEFFRDSSSKTTEEINQFNQLSTALEAQIDTQKALNKHAREYIEDIVKETNRGIQEEINLRKQLEKAQASVARIQQQQLNVQVRLMGHMAQMGHSVMSLARGYAYLTAANEKDLETMLRTIATWEGYVSIVGGAIGGIRTLVQTYQGLKKWLDLATAAQAAYNAQLAITAGLEVTAGVAGAGRGGGGGKGGGVGGVLGDVGMGGAGYMAGRYGKAAWKAAQPMLKTAGKFAGRALPLVGAGMVAYDAYNSASVLWDEGAADRAASEGAKGSLWSTITDPMNMLSLPGMASIPWKIADRAINADVYGAQRASEEKTARMERQRAINRNNAIQKARNSLYMDQQYSESFEATSAGYGYQTGYQRAALGVDLDPTNARLSQPDRDRKKIEAQLAVARSAQSAPISAGMSDAQQQDILARRKDALEQEVRLLHELEEVNNRVREEEIASRKAALQGLKDQHAMMMDKAAQFQQQAIGTEAYLGGASRSDQKRITNALKKYKGGGELSAQELQLLSPMEATLGGSFTDYKEKRLRQLHDDSLLRAGLDSGATGAQQARGKAGFWKKQAKQVEAQIKTQHELTIKLEREDQQKDQQFAQEMAKVVSEMMDETMKIMKEEFEVALRQRWNENMARQDFVPVPDAEK